MEKVEGVYTYWCPGCETSFAVASKFKNKGDFNKFLFCPKCQSSADLTGDGFIRYTYYEQTKEENNHLDTEESDALPDILNAEDIARYLKISRRRVYEIMKQHDFPLVPLGVSKRVLKEDFFKWLHSLKNS
jgi:predicted DNA-binding transcriptional regulator AlpA